MTKQQQPASSAYVSLSFSVPPASRDRWRLLLSAHRAQFSSGVAMLDTAMDLLERQFGRPLPPRIVRKPPDG